VFGGVTPLRWDSPEECDWPSDDSVKSFLFTLKNPHNTCPRKFALKAEEKQMAIKCDSDVGPCFGDGEVEISDNCNANTDSYTSLGYSYINDTGLDGDSVFTGSGDFTVKEIEVFEITD
jgi:hypothetical protein